MELDKSRENIHANGCSMLHKKYGEMLAIQLSETRQIQRHIN